MNQLWDWFWAAASTSIKQYHLQCVGFDNVRAITLLHPEDFQRHDMPFGHHTQFIMPKRPWERKIRDCKNHLYALAHVDL